MSIDHLLNICFLILFLSLLVIVPYYLYWKRRTMGQILYYRSIPRFHKVLLGAMIVLWVGVILVQIVLVVNNGWQSSSKLWPMLGLTLPLLFSLSSLNRFEIRQTGIYSQGRFTKWKDLYAFQWKEEGDYKLGLGAETYILGLHMLGDRFPWWLEWDKFQPNQREDIDKLLSQYLPKAA